MKVRTPMGRRHRDEGETMPGCSCADSYDISAGERYMVSLGDHFPKTMTERNDTKVYNFRIRPQLLISLGQLDKDSGI